MSTARFRLFALIILGMCITLAGSQSASAGQALRNRAELPSGGPRPPAPAASSGLGRVEQGLSGFRNTIWTSDNISVCWENPGTNDSTERGWVQSTIAATWEAVSLVRFTGWETCTSGSRGVRIRTGDYHPHVEEAGSDLDGKSGGMKLNFFWNGCGSASHEQCVKWVAVHEFGHALGFAHEQNRADAPAWCREESQWKTGDIYISGYDPQSIMNYCSTTWNNGGMLSASDIAGIQAWYGPAQSSGQPWMPDCRNDVVLYQDINYGGRAVQITGTMDGLGVIDFNDRASSVCVPAGLILNLYERTGFAGRVVTLVGPTMRRGLSSAAIGTADDWNDLVSSVQLIDARTADILYDAPQTCSNNAVLFQDSFFRGKNVRVSADVPNFSTTGFNDSASSVCVPRGKTLILFQDANYRGAQMAIAGTGFRADLSTSGWNDRVSSAQLH